VRVQEQQNRQGDVQQCLLPATEPQHRVPTPIHRAVFVPARATLCYNRLSATVLFTTQKPLDFKSLIYSRQSLKHPQATQRIAFPAVTRISGRVKVTRADVLLTLKKISIKYSFINNDLPLLTYCELLC
jgi:hypothetical protein